MKGDLDDLQRRLPAGGSVVVLLFGPTSRSKAVAFTLTRSGRALLDSVQLDGTHRYAQPLRRLLSHVPPGSIDAVGLSAHASGWVLGPWKGKHPFLTLEHLNREVFDRYRPALVVFDACMMGTMAALYPLSSHVRIAVASPGLHPYVSPFRTAAFVASVAPTALATLAAQRRMARRIVAEWAHASSFDRGRCMLAFDVRCVKRLAPSVRRHWPRLLFDRRAQLHDKDANLFDLWTAARHIPDLQRRLERCVLPGCKPIHSDNNRRCCFPCQRVRSVAVEARVPGKWQHVYVRNEWARHMKGTHRHAHPQNAPPHPNPRIPKNLRPRTRHKPKTTS